MHRVVEPERRYSQSGSYTSVRICIQSNREKVIVANIILPVVWQLRLDPPKKCKYGRYGCIPLALSTASSPTQVTGLIAGPAMLPGTQRWVQQLLSS